MQPTIKQQKFVENILHNVKTGKGTQKSAYLDAGYKAKNSQIARSNASRLASSPKIKKSLAELFDENGITREIILEKFKKLLNSKDQRVVFQMIDMYNKLKDEYPAGKLKLGAIEGIEDIFTQDDLKKQ